jgi:hypothetical protein
MSSSKTQGLSLVAADAVDAFKIALDSQGRKVWRINETDSLRLIKLLVWSERYSVSLEYILATILPILTKAVERRTGRKSKGLGTTISVLTGEVAKDILLEKIRKDFPGQEHVHQLREQRRNEMVERLDEELNGRPKNPLMYRTATEFTKAYIASIARKRKEREEIEEKIASMPFRGNPFR